MSDQMEIMVNSFKVKVEKIDGLEGYYLENPRDWNKSIAEVLAAEDDIILSDLHWKIIENLRNHYDEYQVIPALEALKNEILKPIGLTFAEFRGLFAKGIYQASRIAGVAPPTGYGYTL